MPREFRSLLVVLAIAAIGATASAENRALLVGVGKYQVEKASLPGIENDLAEMRRVALQMGFADTQIKVLRDEQATLAGIRSAFADWLKAGVSPGDRALFYYSGHGSYVPDRNGDEVDGVDEVLLPYDTGAVKGDLVNVLVDDELGSLLDGLPTTEVYVILDSCHSGTATRELGGGEYVARFFKYDGMPVPAPVATATRGMDFFGRGAPATDEDRVVLTAATEQEQALGGKRGGLFTFAVSEIVNHATTNGLAVTPRDIREVSAQLIARVLEAKPALIFHPQLYGSPRLASANVLAAPVGTTPASPPAPAPAPATAQASVGAVPTAPPEPPVPPQTPVPAPAVAAPPAPAPPAPAPAVAEPPAVPPAPAPPAPAPAVAEPPAEAPKPPTPPAAPRPPAPAPAPAVAAPPAMPPAPAEGPWSALEALTKGAHYGLVVSPRQQAYRVGENLVIDVEVPSDGYLNVLNVGEGEGETVVLFPNKYRPDNAVRAGQRITIPGPDAPFALPAELPEGRSEQRTLIVVVHTKRPLSAYEAGAGDGFLKQLSGRATRSFTVAAAARDHQFGAGQALVVIKP